MGLTSAITSTVLEQGKECLFGFVKDSAIQYQYDKELLNAIQEYFRRQNEVVFQNADLYREVDFGGILQYVNGVLLSDIHTYLLQQDPTAREKYRKTILAKIQSCFSGINEDLAEKITNDILDISRHFYADRCDPAIAARIAQEHDEMQNQFKDVKRLLNKIENNKNSNTASLFDDTQVSFPIFSHYLTAPPSKVDISTFVSRDKEICELENLLINKGCNLL